MAIVIFYFEEKYMRQHKKKIRKSHIVRHLVSYFSYENNFIIFKLHVYREWRSCLEK